MPPQVLLARLDEAPMDAARYRLCFLASGGTLIDGFSIFMLGVALPLIAAELHIGSVTMGLVGAALVLGAAVGALLGGPAADRFGRKAAFLVDMGILAAGAAVSAVARDPTLLLLGQFLVGVGIGIDFPVSGSYVSEVTPRKARSRMVVATIALQSLGMLVGAVMTIGLLDRTGDPSVWRIIIATPGAVAVVFLALRLSLPESPRWLIAHGRADDAVAVVDRLAPASAAVPLMAAPANAAAPVSAIAGPGAKRPALAILFSPEYRTRTLLVSVPWFLMDIATYGVGLFTPVILGAMHFGAGATGPVAADFADAKGSGAIDLFLLVGFLVGLWAVPRFGRIRMQVLGFAGMALGMLILIYTTLAGGGPAAHIPLVLAGFILFNLAMNAGPNATTFSLGPELFPTEVRASASGFAAATAKVGATLGTFLLPQVKAEFGLTGVLVLMAAVAALGAVVTAAFALEVHEGRSLEEAGTHPV
jgi:MFS transporter, putative metabolite transport protein